MTQVYEVEYKVNNNKHLLRVIHEGRCLASAYSYDKQACMQTVIKSMKARGLTGKLKVVEWSN